MADPDPTTRNILAAAIVLMIAFLAYAVMTMPDDRNATEKIGDAIHDLPQGVDKAALQLEDRTPAQRLGDKIKDTTDPH